MKYSIEEIDKMRDIIQIKVTGIFSESNRQREANTHCEELLRTYMTNGTTLKELEDKFKNKPDYIDGRKYIDGKLR